MHGLVILDDKDEVIRPAILWNDNRTAEQCDYLNNVIGKDRLISYTGNIAYAGFTAPKLLWLKENEPESFKRIAKIMLPKDYVAYKASGVFATDVSDASGTLYFDVKGKKWSAGMLEILGVPESLLPKVFESYEAVGKVSRQFAEATGISPDALVVIGGGDQAVGAVGTGTVRDGQLSISLGTSGVLFAPTDSFIEEKYSRLHSFCHANGKFHIMGVMLSAAGSFDWWVRDVLGSDDFEGVINKAASVDTDNILFLPYLMGERSPINDPKARGTLTNLSLSHTTAHITKAILEGICLGLKDSFKVLEQFGLSIECARVIGGGSKSAVWVQLLSGRQGEAVLRLRYS